MWDETSDETMRKATIEFCLSPLCNCNAQNLKSTLQRAFRLRAKIVHRSDNTTKIVVMGDIMSIESRPVFG